jgi:hypothetical protein
MTRFTLVGSHFRGNVLLAPADNQAWMPATAGVTVRLEARRNIKTA